jgi:hypothetical protein
MRNAHRIASALVLALLAFAPVARAQARLGGNGFQNGFGGFNNGFGGGFNNGFGGGFNNGFGGGFNNGFGPVGAVGGGFGPMGFNNGNGNGFAFGFGGPMNGGGMAMVYGPGVGFGGNNFGMQQGFFNPMAMGGVGMLPPQAFAANNLGGVAMAIDQQVVRRPAGALPAVRRRRR